MKPVTAIIEAAATRFVRRFARRPASQVRTACAACASPMTILESDELRPLCETCLAKPPTLCLAPGCVEPPRDDRVRFCGRHFDRALLCVAPDCIEWTPADSLRRLCSFHSRPGEVNLPVVPHRRWFAALLYGPAMFDLKEREVAAAHEAEDVTDELAGTTPVLRVDEHSESDLQWWANRWYEGEIGGPSAQASKFERLPPHRDVLTNEIDDDDPELRFMPGRIDSSVRNREPSTGQRFAVQRLRRIEKQIRQCTAAQGAMILAAYRRPTDEERRGLRLYELRVAPKERAAGAKDADTFSRCVLFSQAARSRWAASAGVDWNAAGTQKLIRARNEAFRRWLVDLAQRSEAGPGRLSGKTLKQFETDRERARRMVQEILLGTQMELAAALTAYGAGVKGCRLPPSTTLRQLGKVMGLNHETVRDELDKREIEYEKAARRGQSHSVSTRQFPSRWPEAALALAR